jgi:hypothetical protein
MVQHRGVSGKICGRASGYCYPPQQTSTFDDLFSNCRSTESGARVDGQAGTVMRYIGKL